MHVVNLRVAKLFLLLGWLASSSLPAVSAKAATSVRRVRIMATFDQDWRFVKADVAGSEQPNFQDAPWRSVNLPHDWSIEGPFDQSNPTGHAGAYLPAGVGWYRKHFSVPADYATRRVFIDFDGIMANSDVWINGTHLGHRPYGYVSFRYELTRHLKFGADRPNILAVRADNSAQPASRWYAGAGIYRHVRLIITDSIHLDHWATSVTTPAVSASAATVHLRSTVVNQSDTPRQVTLQFILFDLNGYPVGTGKAATEPQNIAASASADFEQEITVKNPQLWDLDHPVLYRAVIKVRIGGKTLDDDVTSFGIREFRFDAATGFWLNGRNFKIKGVCLHQDGGAFGVAVPLGVWERRLEQLKQIGVNSIRTAHNPVAPDFLDLCDRLGLLVMDEMFDCWTVAKNPYDYHLYFNEWSTVDTRDTVRRDRNHPSIILYSAGNEIHDTPKAELARGILKSLVDVFHEADPTRPVTQALFRPNVSHDYDDGLADLLDVVGQNYRENEILAAHEAKPTRKIVGTENGHDRLVWLALRDHPPYAGQFLWAGIDYLGETPRWPAVASYSGILDRTGAPKPLAFERQSWWSDKPMVHVARRAAPPPVPPTDPGYGPVPQRRVQTLFSDWTPANSSAHEENVEVYSNCEEVELSLNGKSLGTKSRPADDAARTWVVPFEPGTLKALGKNKGQIVATHELHTAGKPAKIMLVAETTKVANDWNDVDYVTATVVDGHDVIVPTAGDLIKFKITGPGVIAAVDNSDNTSHESFQASERHAFQGRCIAVIKANGSSGRVVLTASATGLASASIAVKTVSAKAW